MTSILDHLTAIIVGSVLLVALFFVQRSSQTTAIVATERYQTETQTESFLETVQQDVENIRSVRQTQHAFGGHRFSMRQATGTDGNRYTSQFTFATLLDPDLGNLSEVAVVTYTVTPTGESTQVGGALRPLYNATRYVTLRGGGPERTGGALRLIDFDITSTRPSGAQLTSVTNINETPVRVNLKVSAAPSPRLSAGPNSGLRGTQLSRMVRILNATATGGLPPVDTTEPPGIANQPGDPPPVLPSPVPSPGTGTGTGTGGTGTSAGSGTGNNSGSGTGVPTPPPPSPYPTGGEL